MYRVYLINSRISDNILIIVIITYLFHNKNLNKTSEVLYYLNVLGLHNYRPL